MRPRLRSWSLWSAAISLPLLATPAAAYVRTLDDTSGAPVAWKGPTIVFSLSRKAASRDIQPSDMHTAVTSALAAWARPALGCTSINLRLHAQPAATDRVARDGVNAIFFREDAWCRNGDERQGCYDLQAQAATSVFLREGGAGEIVEADIEINAVAFRWTTDGAPPRDALSNERDLQTTVAHEIGHALGFAHTCDDGQFSLPPTDHQGKPLLPCRDASPSAGVAIMHPEVRGARAVRRVPSPDERQAACDVYPARSAAACGCEVGRSENARPGSGGAAALPCAALLLALTCRQRARQQSSAHARRSRR